MIEKLTHAGVDGGTPTTTSSGYDAILATGGTLAYETDQTFRGAAVSILATGTTTSGALYGSKDITATETLAFDIPVKPITLPSAELYFLQLGTGTTRNIALATTNTGLLRVRDAANANAWSSAAGALVPGSPCILSVYVTRHASAGTFRIVVYEEDGTTIRVDSGLQTAKNTGAAAYNNIRASGAKSATGAVASQWLWGEPRWDIAATGVLPAWSPPAAHQPFRMGVGGKYVPVNLLLGVGGGYVPLVTTA